MPRGIFSSRKRPITSPCSAVFTSSATITLMSPISLGDPPRLQRPGDLVVVGDRDRPEAAVAGRLEQHLDRRRAVGRVVGVHVQVDLDQRPPGDPPPRRGVAVAVVAAGGEPPVDRLELGRDRGPVAPRPGRFDQLVGAGEVALEQLAGRRASPRSGRRGGRRRSRPAAAPPGSRGPAPGARGRSRR